jgi:hypothetical protein
MFEYFIVAPLWAGTITFIAAGLIIRRNQKGI